MVRPTLATLCWSKTLPTCTPDQGPNKREGGATLNELSVDLLKSQGLIADFRSPATRVRISIAKASLPFCPAYKTWPG